eukprot:COSAG04_NODE_805_length_10154_cov_9.105122_12_plen_80_part_00
MTPVGKTIASPLRISGLKRNSDAAECSTARRSEAKEPPTPPAFFVELARSRAICVKQMGTVSDNLFDARRKFHFQNGRC